MAKTSKKPKNIYMDYASSAEPNPSSIHEVGVKARAGLEKARHMVAEVLGAQAEEIVFTASGTEANNLAILGLVKKGHIITTNIEHPSVLETCRYLKREKKISLTVVEVEPNGIVDPEKIKKALSRATALVSVMYANNEIGTTQPLREIAKIIRHFNKHNNTKILFHTDAVQGAKYLDLNISHLGVDMLTLSGSKLLGSLGAGMLYKNKNIKLGKILHGGDQEYGIRAGTENVKAIENFATVLVLAKKTKDKEYARLLKLKKYFVASLSRLNLDSSIIINGDLENSLPNIVNITILKIPSDLLVIELSARGIFISSKSACKSGEEGDSHVIKALRKQDTNSLRFSFGEDTTKADIDYTLKSLQDILKKLKPWYTS